VLKAYGNSVALYNDGKVNAVFGGISLDELPDEDKRILENGIAFPTREEAVQAVEDYE
jgi:calcineurin-like phosphoesterase